MSDQLSYMEMLRLYTTLGDERESSPSLKSEVLMPDSSAASVARPLSRTPSAQFPLHRDVPFTFAHDHSFNDSPFTNLPSNVPGADLPYNMDNQAHPMLDQSMGVDVDRIQEMYDVAGLSYIDETKTYEVQNFGNTLQAHRWDTSCSSLSTFEPHGPSSSGGDGVDENQPRTVQSNHKGKSRAASSPTRSQPFRPVLAPDNIPTCPPMESAIAISPNARGRPHAMPDVGTSKDVDHIMPNGGVRKASKASSSKKRKRGRKLPSAMSSGVDVNNERRNCKGRGRLGAVSLASEMVHNASATVDESRPAESEAVEAVPDNVQSSDIIVASHSGYNLRRSSHKSQPTFAAGTAPASTRGKRRRSLPPAASSSRGPPSTSSSAVAASDDSDEDSDHDEPGPSSSAKKARLVTSSPEDTVLSVYAPFQRYVLNGQSSAARIVTCRVNGCRALLSHSHIDAAIHHWRGHFAKGKRNNGSEGDKTCPWRGCTERGAYSVLERHFFKEHFGVVFKCTGCSYSCSRQSSFDLHLKRHRD